MWEEERNALLGRKISELGLRPGIEIPLYVSVIVHVSGCDDASSLTNRR